MSIDDDRNLANLVSDRLPEFVRVDHPTLVSFLSAYYEWLGLRRNSGKILSPMEMHDIPDIDTTLDQFVDDFRSQYLLNFPESLAINKDSSRTLSSSMQQREQRSHMNSFLEFYTTRQSSSIIQRRTYFNCHQEGGHKTTTFVFRML